MGLLFLGRKIHGFIKLFLVLMLVFGINIFTVIFVFLQFIDLFCILFLIYTDGNGMPLYLKNMIIFKIIDFNIL